MFKLKLKIIVSLKLLIICILIFLKIFKNKKKKIGVIGLSHCNNIGNNLLKYAINIKLSELGFEPKRYYIH